jgi:hypothetical protein
MVKRKEWKRKRKRTSPAGLANTRSRRLSATGDLRDYATRLTTHVDTSLPMQVHIYTLILLSFSEASYAPG